MNQFEENDNYATFIDVLKHDSRARTMITDTVSKIVEQVVIDVGSQLETEFNVPVERFVELLETTYKEKYPEAVKDAMRKAGYPNG